MCPNSPAPELPECATRSISVNPGLLHVPVVRLHRDLVFQQQARLSASVKSPARLQLLVPQSPVHLPRADRQQLPLRLAAHLEALANPWHPRRQHRLQPHRPGVSRRFPHRRQNRQRLPPVAQRASAPNLPRLASRARTRPVQQPNGVLSVIPRVQTEFIQNRLPRFPITSLIAPIDRTKILPPRLVTHVTLLTFLTDSGYILNGATTSLGLHFRWRDTGPCNQRRSSVCYRSVGK